MTTPERQRLCPICKRPVDAKSPAKPFCSQRCKSIDLAQWLSGTYRIPGPPAEPDHDEEQQSGEEDRSDRH